MFIDAHLDLAFNVSRGRDVTAPARAQPVADNEIATVGLPDLRAGGAMMICATIFCEPRSRVFLQGYSDPAGAHEIARRQLGWYHTQFGAGRLRPVLRSADVPDAPPATDQPLATILLLEGADAIRDQNDLEYLHAQGVRVIGLAWKRTAHAGGTGEPAGLSPLGRRTVAQIDALRLIHDTSHLAEQAFWELLDITDGPVITSHSNCRHFVPTDRQLSDAMIRALIRRGGVIGINFFDKFLLPPEQQGKRRATLNDVADHVLHICELAGGAGHVALGTDMDGGLGREQIPVEITTAADVPRLAQTLRDRGMNDDDIHSVMHRNWARFFRDKLDRSGD